ncbi:MAG TPA: sugar ABC transporter ATP-binding protein [Armatimonadota bacterium]
MSDLLGMRGITKQFPGVKALDSVDFSLRPGEVRALMGENGAGKSTLIKVLTGVYQRDAGDVVFEGKSIAPKSPLDAQALGISTVYQEVNLIPHLSVAENLFLGRQPTRFGRVNWREVNQRARDAIKRLDLDIDVTQSVSSYSIAIQQMVAIARSLDVQARLLILDEPTSSLDAREVELLFDLIRRLRDQGLSIIFVTHFLDQVYRISDGITVLRNGRLVGHYPAADLPRLELIARMMGKEVSEIEAMGARVEREADAGSREPFLVAKGLGRQGAMEPFDLEIREGEALGLAGLLGSGRTESARLLFGADRADHGTVEVDGKPVSMTSPRRAIARGLGFCPEDRKTEAIIPNLSIRQNIILALQARRGVLRYLPHAKQQEIADRYIRALSIATPDADKPIKELSGGNQQKAILARWLAAEPRLLILDEPTRGIDVGAKAEIEKLIRTLCKDGKAILFISSELEEVTRAADRVAVLRDRSKVGELRGDAITESAILRTIAESAEGDTKGATDGRG